MNLAVEDPLSEAVARTILQQSSSDFHVGRVFTRGGSGYLRSTINGFNNAAKGCPFLVLTDLDSAPSFAAIRDNWMTHPIHPNLVFRVAVRAIESWVLADRPGIAAFLGVPAELIPRDVDSIADPKQELIELARRSRYANIRSDIVPPASSTRAIGPNYNGRLVGFVENKWSAEIAAECSASLARAIQRINLFEPVWR